MFPLFTISNWRPFAPAELPAFIATMGTSDSPAPPPSPSLFTLVGECALFRADEKDLLGYCQFVMSDSRRPAIPGGHNRLALAPVALLPAGA